MAMIPNRIPTTNVTASKRGFTLLIAVILSSVTLALALALLDVAYKQVTLAFAAKNSHQAFANADTALECALYYDQKNDLFGYGATSVGVTTTCNGRTDAVTFDNTPNPPNPRIRTFTLSCAGAGGGEYAKVTIYKWSDASTSIYANGYSSCASSDLRRAERGVKISY
jgi:hypothetical protein